MPNNVQMTEGELFARLEAATPSVLLTSNPRAARTLRDRYNTWQQKKNRTGWRTPRILTWDAWLVEIWDGLAMAGAVQQALLTNTQERAVWLQGMRAHHEDVDTLYSDSFAELAQASHAMMEEYKISFAELEQAAAGKDALAFLAWVRAFRGQCKRRQFLSSSALARILKAKIDEGLSETIQLPQEILLVGFDRVPPLQQALLTALQQKGCACELLWLTPEGRSRVAPVLLAARNAEEELQTVAHWIRERLLQNPEQRIGVLAPSITESRDAMDRVFRRVLAPSALRLASDPGTQEPQLPYEFSLGVPLRQIPQVRAALLLLRWLTQPIAWEAVSFLLTSGHIGVGSLADRARLDAAIRKEPQSMGAEAEFAWLLRRLRQKDVAHLTGWQQSMGSVATLAQNALDSKTALGTETANRSYADWRELVEQMLRAAEWTLFSTQTSAEFQLLARWDQLLDELSTLDAVAERVSFSTLLAALADAAQRTLYTLETQNAPAQILGIPESA